MDRLSDRTLAEVIASVEAAPLDAPSDLSGEARELFVAIAQSNRSRAWGNAQVGILADYCRLSILYAAEFSRLESEGLVVENGNRTKSNPRITALRGLNIERHRFARILGLTATRDRRLGSYAHSDHAARETGAALLESREGDRRGLLA